jgi:hypothetical protein
MPIKAKIFVAITVAIGSAGLIAALLQWHPGDPLKFACYLLLAIVAATMKVKLPGMDSTMSVHFLCVLMSVLDLSLAETLVIGCSAALVQSVWKNARRPDPIKVVFNVLGLMANAVLMTYLAYHFSAGILKGSLPLELLVASCTYFAGNTIPLSLLSGNFADGMWQGIVWQQESVFWGCYRLEL